MLKYIFKRILNLIPVVFIISIVLFLMLHAMPGDPVKSQIPRDDPRLSDPVVRQKIYDEIAAELGYDQPLPVQYIRWVGRTVSGDLGFSTMYQKPVKEVVGRPLMNSVILNFASTILSFVISIIVGIKSAVRRGKLYDSFWQVMSMIGFSLPTFFIGMTLIYVFSLKLGWLPSQGMANYLTLVEKGQFAYFLEWIKYLILPTATLTVGSFASTSRYVRNSMLEALSQDYIRTARSKGLAEKKVIYSHAFRNALIPVVTVVAWGIAGMFGGSAITERIFAYNGIGDLLIQAIFQRDFQLVLTMNMFYTIVALSANLLMDVGYALVDPRIKLE